MVVNSSQANARAITLLPGLQVLGTVTAILLGMWTHLPGACLAFLGLWGCSLTLATLASEPIGECYRKGTVLAAWLITLAIPATLALDRSTPFTPDPYHSFMAWLLALVAGTAAFGRGPAPLKSHCRVLSLLWGLVGSCLWLVSSYANNVAGSFYFGLCLTLVCLLLSKGWLRLPGLAIQVVNTLILIVIGLPITDWLVRPTYRLDGRHPETGRLYYSYDAAKHDPAAFGRWWHYYLEQWDLMAKDVFTPDPRRQLPFRLRPNGRGHLFQSRIAINSLGFRGKEISREKGNTYRIVALGESTTYGCTLKAEDQPWPEVLEQLIRERLNPQRPVEVINAGVPAYLLTHNLARFASDILPLRPDMVISYHGINGFGLLDEALPPLTGRPPPYYQARPLALLARVEHQIKILRRRHEQTARLRLRQPRFGDLMGTKYAQAYRDFIQITTTNGIRPVVANFCLAVNEGSPAPVVEFYGSMFPVVSWRIKANQAHSLLLENLARERSDVCFVDTHPNLDGVYQKFIDVAHLTQEGRRQLAENIFAGIRQVLESDLEGSSQTARPRP